MDEIVQDVATESSPAPSEPAAPAQAPSAPAQPADPDAGVPFHRHPRFQQLIRENQSYKQQMGQLQQRLQQLESLSQQSQQGGGLSREEQQQYTEAAAALKKILAADPELKQLLGVTKQLPQLAQGYQSVQQLTHAQRQQQQAAARSHIESLVKDSGIAVDKKSLPHIIRLVAGQAMAQPDGNERFERGDMTVLSEAFDEVKAFIEGFRKPAVATTVQTKTKTQTLPPAPRGSHAGPEAPPKPEAGKEREFARGLHQRALAMLKGGQASES